jgi:hypothetical protein
MESLRRITESNKRAHSAARSWEASGSQLSLKEWVQEQKELWAAVKPETREVTIPVAPNSASVLATQTVREVIDLTLD